MQILVLNALIAKLVTKWFRSTIQGGGASPTIPLEKKSHVLVSVLSSSQSDDLGNNCMATFDIDSAFWVCDNSATSHICNDVKFFKGSLVPADVSVSLAPGVSNQLTVGTVVLTFQDDK